jgi:uncharacterized repeat protein (TIGR01451 family)
LRRLLTLFFLMGAVAFAQTPSETEISNSVTMQYTFHDTVRELVSNTVVTEVDSVFGLDVQKAASVDSVSAGDTLIYLITMDNTGNIPLSSYSLIDTLPEHLEFVSADPTATNSGQTITWSMNNLDIGDSKQIDLTTVVREESPSAATLRNVAWVETPFSEAIPSNESIVELETIIVPTPLLSVQSETELVTIPGDTLLYTILYSNHGIGDANSIELTNELHSLVAPLDGSTSAIYDDGERTLTWSLENLAAGESGQVSFYGLVSNAANRGDQILNKTRIQGAAGSQDSSSFATLVRAPEIIIGLEASSQIVNAGDVFEYFITANNFGDTTATNVVLIDSLSANVEFVTSNLGGIYDSTTHTVSWDIGTLESGSSSASAEKKGEVINHTVTSSLKSETIYTIEVQVSNVIPNGTMIPNTALVFDGESGATSAASAATGLAVHSSPILSFAKSADVEVFPGDTVHYDLHITNIGSDNATGLVVRDTLDQRLTLVSISGVYQYDPTSRAITWDLGSLAVNQSTQMNVIVTAPTDLNDGEFILNHAWAQSNETTAIRAEARTTNILPLSVDLTTSPEFILGNGEASSQLSAAVYTFLGNPAPDGISVNFFTNAGNIPDSISTIETKDGMAVTTLTSDVVVDEPVTAHVTARAQYSATKYALDLTEVTFLIGAFEGIIMNTKGEPQTDVLVELFSITRDTFAGSDSTDETGYYLIPILQDDLYRISYTIIGSDGLAYVNTQEIMIETPDEGAVVTNLNSVSGWIYDAISGEIIVEDSLLVILLGNPDTTGFGSLGSSLGLGKVADHHFNDSTYTDSTGQYFFTNLLPGEYQIILDYSGTESYSDASMSLNLTQPGAYVVNANMAIRQSPFFLYKEVEQSEAAVGDTVDYTINIGALQNWADSLFIIDRLPQDLEYVNSIVPASVNFESYDTFNNEIRFNSASMSILDTLSLTIQAVVKSGAGLGPVENIAFVTTGIDTTYSYDDTRTGATTNIIFPYLKLEKKANKRTVEPGDVITYTIRVTNLSSTESVHDFTFDDILPRGFKYRKGTSHFRGEKISDPSAQRSGKNRMALTWNMADTLAAHETYELTYRIIVGLSSQVGIATNEIMGYANTFQDYPVESNKATAEVTVRPGLLSDRGLIIGKIYFDTNSNGLHDNNERTVKNVELIMETGARIRTDEYGKFSVPDVSAAMHVLRINERTLPELVKVKNDSPDYLGDTRSRIVRVAAGGIAKVSIALEEEAIPGTITGVSYYDANQNFTFDAGEEVQGNIRFILNDTLSSQSDSSGQFVLTDVPMGSSQLTLDESTLPGYAFLAIEEDSTADEFTGWELNLKSGDSVTVNVPLQKREMTIAISKQATLKMQTEMITKEFRLIAYKPWTTTINYGFATAKAELQPAIIEELKRVAELLKWQQQINLDVNGHTDNIPIGNGGTFADNAELSQARADAIKDYLITEGRISADRIKATGYGDAQPAATNDTPEGRAENRRVEMNFYHAGDDDSDYNQLQFRYDINYSGEIEALNVRFHQSLPLGFGIKPASTILSGKTLEIANSDSTGDELALGDWKSETHQELDVAIRPDDFEKIETTGIVVASLEYLDEDGNKVFTDSLQTMITTVVSTISFNLILEGTQFGSGSADLQESALPALRKLGDFMTWQPEINIVIEGFTDNMGAEAYNVYLSRQRAASVRDFLLNNYPGVKPAMIEIKGHGPRYPVGDNTSWLGRRANRRVEVVVNAEVGEATVLEAKVLNEKLVNTISRPPQPFNVLGDSMITIPAGQNSMLTMHMEFPGYAAADSISMTVNLLNGSYFTETEISSQTWRQSLIPGEGTFELPIQVMIPEKNTEKQEIIVYVDLFKDGEYISGQIQKIMKIGLK